MYSEQRRDSGADGVAEVMKGFQHQLYQLFRWSMRDDQVS